MGSAINSLHCCNSGQHSKEATNVDLTKIKSPILSDSKFDMSPRRIASSQIMETSLKGHIMPPLTNLNIIKSNSFALRSANSRSTTKCQTPIKTNKIKKQFSIEVVHEQYSQEHLKMIKKLLLNQKIMLREMDLASFNLFINSSIFYRVKENFVFYSFDYSTKENNDDKIYIVLKGEINVILNNDKKFKYGKNTLINTKLLKKSYNKILLKSAEKHIYLFSLFHDKYLSILKEYKEKMIEEKTNIIKNLYLFSNLDKRLQIQIANEVDIIKVSSRLLLIQENSFSDSFYVLLDGTFLVSRNEQIEYKISTQYSIVGDMTFFTNQMSFYSFYADEDSKIFQIKYKKIKEIFNCNKENYTQRILLSIFSKAIKDCSILSKYFSSFNIANFFKIFEMKYYFNDTVVNKRQNKLVLLLSGSLYVKSKTKHLVGGLGQIIKEPLINNYFAISTNECVVLEAQWNEVLKSIKSYTVKKYTLFQIVTLIRNNLQSMGIKHLSEYKLLKIAESVKPMKFSPGELIFLGGPVYEKMFIILTGTVSEMLNDIEIKTYNETESFGDIIHTADHYDIVTSYSAKCSTECIYIEKKYFEGVVEADFLKSFQKMLTKTDTILSEKKRICLDSLYYIKDLGQGSYGKVYLVSDFKNFYAMKTAEIQAMDLNHERAQYYLDEKTIMLTINFPFIVKLYKTFKTREYIFFLQEFVNGITLRSWMDTFKNKNNLRNLVEVKFYGSIMAMILDYLETKRIIHRDLKPDNLIINNQGYLKAIDFGVAKNITGTDSTNSLIGTCHYMAPEITLGKSYSFAVDYWSMGIVLYEIFYGKVPFGFGYEDPVKIYKEITDSNPMLPSDEKNEKFNDLLKQLLCKNPNKRLQSFENIRKSDFYKDYDFEKVMKKEIEPPFIPPQDSLMEKTDINSLNVSDFCSFEKFMKNHVFCSSNELDQLINKQQNEDLFDNF